MVMPTRNTYRKKAPPGYRWKAVQVEGARPGTLITKHILVKIESAKAPPETIFTAEESIRGAEDRQASMPDIVPGEKRRLKEATIPLGYGQDEGEIDDGLSLLDTKVLLDQTQAKRRVPPPPQYPPQASGALPPPAAPDPRFQPFLPGQDMGMDDPTWSRAERQASGTVPFNPYKDNVGPVYGEEMRNVDPFSFKGRQKDVDALGVFGRGTHVGWGADGQAIYMDDIISVGPGGTARAATGTVKLIPRMINAVKSFFKKKGTTTPKPTKPSPEVGTVINPATGRPFTAAETAAASVKGTSRTRRVLSKIAPGRKTEVVAATALTAGLAGELSDNALWNRFKDATVEQLEKYGFTPDQIKKIAKEGKDAIVQAATETTPEYKARLARGEAAKSIRAKGLLDLPDKDARAGTEFFGAGDVAGDTLIPEKAKAPVAAVEDPLKKFWGKYADDPAKRKQKYLDSLSSIWRKAAIMDAIAAATGGESRSPQFMAMMSQRMDAIAKFDDEERLHNIFKAVYYNPETGVYNAPKNKTDAYERAIKLGASPAEAKKIFGYQPEPDEALHEWYYKDPVTNEYVTEHVRGKATMPEGDYNWSKGKTPIITETEEIGGTKNERAWNEIKATLGRGGLEGNLDDAIRIYMQYDKVDPIMGFDVKEARSRAEQHIMSTMTGHERKAYTYTPTEGEELSEERLAELRKLGYAYVIVDGKEEALVWRA